MKRSHVLDESERAAKGAVERTKRGLSRRQVLAGGAMAASALPLVDSFSPRLGAAQARRRGPQGGRGPIKVLLITQFHAFDRAPFYDMFDSFGEEITWTHVDRPAANVFFDPDVAKPWDVFITFGAFGGRVRKPKPGGGFENVDTEPSEELKQGTKALLQQGKGIVFLHHSISSWVHTWPEWVEIMGAAADWGKPLKNIRGKEFPRSGYRQGVEQHISVVDKEHPIVQGLGDGFDIVDEPYLCPVFEDSVHPILRSDFEPIDSNFPKLYERGWRHPKGSNLAGWVKTAEKSPIAYIQPGHDRVGWENESYRTLVMNAMRWAASEEALAWAADNPTKIFK